MTTKSKAAAGAPSKDSQAAAAAPTANEAAMAKEIARLNAALAAASKPAAAAKPAPEPIVLGLPPSAPKFKQAPRYKLLQKAFMSGILIQHGDDWMPFDDVLLDPEAQPFLNKLSGPFGGRGDAERQAINIEFKGIPDEHMEPLNEAADWMMDHIDELKDRALKAAHERRTTRKSRNPIEALTVIGPHATVLEGTGAT